MGNRQHRKVSAAPGLALVLAALLVLCIATDPIAADDPGYGLARCDAPEALKYLDTEIGVPTGQTLSDGSPVCHTLASWTSRNPNRGRPIHPDAWRELVKPPVVAPNVADANPAPEDPDRIRYQQASGAAPIPPSEWDNYDLVDPGAYGTCGGMRPPRDLSRDDLLGVTQVRYLCDRATGVWIKVSHARGAWDHEVDWRAPAACDRQISGLDPHRNVWLTKRNDDFSQAECDTWLLDQLSGEFARRQAAAGGGRPAPYCQVVGIHWYEDRYAYGQVFHNAPDADGDCVSTPVFWGSYADAVDFVATDARCNQTSGSASGSSSPRSAALKSVVAVETRSTLRPRAAQAIAAGESTDAMGDSGETALEPGANPGPASDEAASTSPAAVSEPATKPAPQLAHADVDQPGVEYRVDVDPEFHPAEPDEGRPGHVRQGFAFRAVPQSLNLAGAAQGIDPRSLVTLAGLLATNSMWTVERLDLVLHRGGELWFERWSAVAGIGGRTAEAMARARVDQFVACSEGRSLCVEPIQAAFLKHRHLLQLAPAQTWDAAAAPVALATTSILVGASGSTASRILTNRAVVTNSTPPTRSAAGSQSSDNSPTAPPSAGPIDLSLTASDPCDQPWQVPGSYDPQTGCRQH